MVISHLGEKYDRRYLRNYMTALSQERKTNSTDQLGCPGLRQHRLMPLRRGGKERI